MPLVLMLVLVGACGKQHEVLAPHKGDELPDGGDALDADIDAAQGRDAEVDAELADAEADAQADAGADAAAEAGGDAEVSDAAPDGAEVDEDAGAEPALPEECVEMIEDALDGLPDDIACIGLYSDVRRKIVERGVRPFAPATALWSDGSGKQRWIYLPPGTQIDATVPNDWVFPVGTKLFKEFRVAGRRIETRIYQKRREDRWVRATYEWTRDELTARRSFGTDREDVLIQGQQYHVPSGGECDQCHGGRKDRVLGFEAVSLGMEGAKGLTLKQLVEEDLLTPVPARVTHSIGDDGSGKAAAAMAWLHVNCGVSCHNDDENSEAYSSDLRLELMPNELDGRPSNGFDVWTTAVGVDTKSERWGTDRIRIIAGNPDDSLLMQLITSREGPRDQMPPIATSIVDTDGVLAVREWIATMQDD